MSWFKRKEGPDVLDLSDMRKRGLLPKSAPSTNDEGVVDLSSGDSDSKSVDGDVDFLSHLAGVGNASSSDVSSSNFVHPSPGFVTSSLRDARHRGQLDSQVNEIRLKIDDNDFKLNNMIEKMREIEQRIDKIERG